MWIYLSYITVTFIAYYIIIGSSKCFRLDSGLIVQRNRILFSWFAGVLLWAIYAFRDVSVGSDTVNYFSRFVNVQMPEFSLLSIAGQEWGYDMLQYLCKFLGMSWQVYLAVVSAIIILPIAIFFHRYSSNIWASFFLYITIGLAAVNMSALRQSLAIAMVVVAIILMFENKYVKSVLFILVGSLFHYSALLSFVLLFIPFLKYKTKRILLLLLVIPIFARIYGDYLFGYLNAIMPERYIGAYSEEITMNPILEAVWIFVLLFLFFSLRINSNIRTVEFRLFLLAVLFVASIELSYSVYLAGRLAFYFETAVMVAIPCAITKFHNKNIRVFLSLAIYALCLAFLIVSSYGSDTLVVYDYKFFWE